MVTFEKDLKRLVKEGVVEGEKMMPLIEKQRHP